MQFWPYTSPYIYYFKNLYLCAISKFMRTAINNVLNTWRQALSSRAYRNQLLITLIIFFAVGKHDLYYLRVYQARPGVEINDILLNQLPPHDFSVPIFILEYITMLMVTFITIQYPDRLVKGLQMFSLVILARTICIYLFPLEPPRDMILLNDPMAFLLLHTKDVVVTKDLFFSGHISALSLFMLISPNKYVKAWALFATIVVAILILWQHVHYSLDVAFAPIASFLSYKFILYIHRESRYGLELQGQEQL